MRQLCEGETFENSGDGVLGALHGGTGARPGTAARRPGGVGGCPLGAGQARVRGSPVRVLPPGDTAAVTGAGAAPCGHGSRQPVFCACDPFLPLISRFFFLQKC